MRKEEKRIYITCITGMAVAVVMAVVLMTRPVSAEKAVFADDTVVGEELCPEDPIVAKTGQIREDTGISGMPCESPEQFARFLETYEQETEEETLDGESESGVPSGSEVESATWSEVDAEVETECIQNPIYMVDGQTLQTDLQEYLYQRLADYNIEWFMPYSIMICWQESQFDQYNVSADGLDYGLLQFRKQFWDWSRGDIFDPYAQIDVFVELMANRANSGCDVYEMISRHMQSDYGSYNHEYVATVLSHESKLRKVE